MNPYLDHVAGVAIGILFVLIGRWAFLHPEEKVARFIGGSLLPGKLKNIGVQITGAGLVAVGFSTVGVYCVPHSFWDAHTLQGTFLVPLLAGACTFVVLRRSHLRQLRDNQKRDQIS